MRKLLFFTLTLLMLQSCASFDKSQTNPFPLTENNLSDLDGTYEIVQIDYDSVFKEYKRQVWVWNNFLTDIDRKLLKDTIYIDSSKNYKFGLKVLSPRKIKVIYIENDTVFRERILKAKLKNDGYLYLKKIGRAHV